MFFILGILDAKRDWGYAPEYCEGMWKMLQQEKPQRFCISNWKNCSVRQFVELAFKELNIEIKWKGSGINEVGIR